MEYNAGQILASALLGLCAYQDARSGKVSALVLVGSSAVALTVFLSRQVTLDVVGLAVLLFVGSRLVEKRRWLGSADKYGFLIIAYLNPFYWTPAIIGLALALNYAWRLALGAKRAPLFPFLALMQFLALLSNQI